MTDYKQAILLREDLGMSKGKMIAQACHASLKAYRKSDADIRSEWENSGEKKIALQVTEAELKDKRIQAESSGLISASVKDAGMTELEPGTVTALAIGPDVASDVDSVTGDLQLVK